MSFNNFFEGGGETHHAGLMQVEDQTIHFMLKVEKNNDFQSYSSCKYQYIKQIVNKKTVGMAVQKSTRTRIAEMTASK